MYDRPEMIQVLRTEIDRALRAKADEIWPLGDEFTTEVSFGELATIRGFRVFESYDNKGLYRLYADSPHKNAVVSSEPMDMAMVEYYKDLLRDIAKMDAAHNVIIRLLNDIGSGRIDIGLTGFGTDFVAFAVYPSEHEQIMIDNMAESGLPVREFEGFGDIIEWVDSIYLATATDDPSKVKDENDDLPYPRDFLGELTVAMSEMTGSYLDTVSHPNAADDTDVALDSETGWPQMTDLEKKVSEATGLDRVRVNVDMIDEDREHLAAMGIDVDAEIIRAIQSSLGQEGHAEYNPLEQLEKYREEGGRLFDQIASGPVGYFAGLSPEEREEALAAMPTSGPVPHEPVPEDLAYIQAVLRDGATLEFRDGKVTVRDADGTVQTYAIR